MKGRGHCKLYNSNQRKCHSPHPMTLGNFSLTLVQNDFQKKNDSQKYSTHTFIYFTYIICIFLIQNGLVYYMLWRNIQSLEGRDIYLRYGMMVTQ